MHVTVTAWIECALIICMWAQEQSALAESVPQTLAHNLWKCAKHTTKALTYCYLDIGAIFTAVGVQVGEQVTVQSHAARAKLYRQSRLSRVELHRALCRLLGHALPGAHPAGACIA